MEKKIKALIQQAIDETMSSREIYLTMADLVERPETKETLRYLAENETGHKEKLEYLYDDVAFPEVW
jgi:rubrerythrin